MPGKYYRLRRPAVMARFKYSGQGSYDRVDGETIVAPRSYLSGPSKLNLFDAELYVYVYNHVQYNPYCYRATVGYLSYLYLFTF